jgi:peptide-methionine (R)-S-oxide reductase
VTQLNSSRRGGNFKYSNLTVASIPKLFLFLPSSSPVCFLISYKSLCVSPHSQLSSAPYIQSVTSLLAFLTHITRPPNLSLEVQSSSQCLLFHFCPVSSGPVPLQRCPIRPKRATTNGGPFSPKVRTSPTPNPTSHPNSQTDQFRVLRQQGTEAPFTGEFDKHMPESGVYTCAACNAPLYTAKQKFKSGCGWPAYFDNIPGAVTRHTDGTLGMQRTEIVCSNCGGHLGHVFKGEGYNTPTDERHCVNSVSMKFSPEDPVVDKKTESKV